MIAGCVPSQADDWSDGLWAEVREALEARDAKLAWPDYHGRRENDW